MATYMYNVEEMGHPHKSGKVSYKAPSLVDCNVSSRVGAGTVDSTRHWTLKQ